LNAVLGNRGYTVPTDEHPWLRSLQLWHTLSTRWRHRQGKESLLYRVYNREKKTEKRDRIAALLVTWNSCQWSTNPNWQTYMAFG